MRRGKESGEWKENHYEQHHQAKEGEEDGESSESRCKEQKDPRGSAA